MPNGAPVSKCVEGRQHFFIDITKKIHMAFRVIGSNRITIYLGFEMLVLIPTATMPHTVYITFLNKKNAYAEVKQ